MLITKLEGQRSCPHGTSGMQKRYLHTKNRNVGSESDKRGTMHFGRLRVELFLALGKWKAMKGFVQRGFEG